MNYTKLVMTHTNCGHQDNTNDIVYSCACCVDATCLSPVCGNIVSPITCSTNTIDTSCNRTCSGYNYYIFDCISFQPQYVTVTQTRIQVATATATVTAKSSSDMNTANILLINILMIFLFIKFTF
jgi:hypothetical protein